ncbi:Type I restriction enzyme EcoEI R protein [Candidatus Terasakiella magnetica]|uniref:Type I restriction enzyme EcoEI R protein n=1 Tax=Candidatus Terasakiella magnetica TaxID=1867952 RepID=A0A1C3RFE1_9PROT|nr:DEAD/DEAH box helicase family protein [Candidatus Terasakiella magnetica]SCA55942.1 Type I restriction enzyme EcoEI R protein [Candidatus Terasakiella magnetica]
MKLSETDVKTKFITPAIKKAGWDIHSQMREEVTFTAGRIIVRGKMTARGKTKRADYILYYKPNIPLAIVEAKDNKHTIGSGMQQALEYSEMLDIPFIFSSNGDGFLFHDKSGTSDKVETEIPMDEFPSPDQLWAKYKQYKGLSEDSSEIVAQDYYDDGSGKAPRYYQYIAINRTIEAIAKGQDRILLVMATGTGKTYTAFQIIWRLWKARKKKRILFLADRNILVDQTKQQDFAPFGDKMTKIQNRTADKSYEIYLSLYQAVTGTEESQNIYKQFSPDFFDLIVIDECHRGSASEASAWKKILDYFSSATHIGLTATPKETNDVSNIAYFGDPVYSYSLKQGINDGFLAPYKVVRIDFDKDLEGYRPEKGKTDKYGQLIDDRIYNQRDFDRNLVIEQRTELVAQKVAEFLKQTNPYDKTIIFCEDIDHAERMRQAITNCLPELVNENHRYVMRITGDNEEGKAELDNFINPESRYPVIATTSKLMTTGVDAKTCKLIVLDQRIQSMTEFKQIIGRGTRVNEEYGKKYFTILDFKKATELFADPDFDGEPVQVFEPGTGPDDNVIPEDEGTEEGTVIDNGEEVPVTDITWDDDEDDEKGRTKFYINDVEVDILSKRVQYLDADGKLITESLQDYAKNNVQKTYASLDDFLRRWNEADKKSAIVDELAEQGIPLEALREEVKNGDAYGVFDLICHVAYGQPPLTRKERAENVKKRNYFAKYEDKAKAVLEGLLDKYADEGLTTLEDKKVLKLAPLNSYGTPIEIVKNVFGGKKPYEEAILELENEIFKQAN